MKNPFRYKYWVLRDVVTAGPLRSMLSIVRSRARPNLGFVYELVDGPFDQNEDAVQSLTFWRLQEPEGERVRLRI